MWTTALLPYSPIIWKVIESEKICFSQTQSLITVFNTLTADDKYSLLNRDNLKQPVRTQLSQKQKAFSQFFLPFSKSTFNFEHFQKKDDHNS